VSAEVMLIIIVTSSPIMKFVPL